MVVLGVSPLNQKIPQCTAPLSPRAYIELFDGEVRCGKLQVAHSTSTIDCVGKRRRDCRKFGTGANRKYIAAAFSREPTRKRNKGVARFLKTIVYMVNKAHLRKIRFRKYFTRASDPYLCEFRELARTADRACLPLRRRKDVIKSQSNNATFQHFD